MRLLTMALFVAMEWRANISVPQKGNRQAKLGAHFLMEYDAA